MKDQASRLRELMNGNSALCVTDEIPQDGDRTPRIVAVTSGKGGVGKTTIAVNLAMLFAEIPDSRVLILDADLGLANVDVMLGISSGRNIGHLLHTDYTPEQTASLGPGGVMLISGGSGLQELANSNSEDRRILIGKLLKYFQNFDFVVIDTSPGIGSNIMDFLNLADEILLITSPEPTSLKDSYAALKTIVKEVPGKPVIPVINNASYIHAQQAIKTLNEVAQKFIGWHSDCWYQIESDQMVSRSIQERRPFVRAYPRTPAVINLRSLANYLISLSIKSNSSSI